MGVSKRFVLFLPILVVVMCYCGIAHAQKTGESSGAKAANAKVEAQKNKVKKAKEQKTQSRNSEKKRFVDRDGDGIQDGMEHRFRKRRRHKKGRMKQRGSGQHRHQKGKGHCPGNSSNCGN